MPRRTNIGMSKLRKQEERWKNIVAGIFLGGAFLVALFISVLLTCVSVDKGEGWIVSILRGSVAGVMLTYFGLLIFGRLFYGIRSVTLGMINLPCFFISTAILYVCHGLEEVLVYENSKISTVLVMIFFIMPLAGAGLGIFGILDGVKHGKNIRVWGKHLIAVGGGCCLLYRPAGAWAMSWVFTHSRRYGLFYGAPAGAGKGLEFLFEEMG